ncbi:MAG: extracellular solute-binding protein, partial [Candidatus Omnitrophica bacterium]|nr:extracellular solute-binding protein [Candidatus Omnitrophota bacterium]
MISTVPTPEVVQVKPVPLPEWERYIGIEKVIVNRLTLVFFFFFLITGPVAGAEKEELTIFYASTLAAPIKQVSEEFQKKFPGVFIFCEASGSREAARKVAELKRNADILITADPSVIRDILMPEYADWYINFAGTRMVICFTEQSKFGNEITRDNWYRVLSRPGVQIGRVNPDNSPLGYRTLMTWQLADRYYKPEGTGKSIYDSLYENCPAR